MLEISPRSDNPAANALLVIATRWADLDEFERDALAVVALPSTKTGDRLTVLQSIRDWIDNAETAETDGRTRQVELFTDSAIREAEEAVAADRLNAEREHWASVYGAGLTNGRHAAPTLAAVK